MQHPNPQPTQNWPRSAASAVRSDAYRQFHPRPDNAAWWATARDGHSVIYPLALRVYSFDRWVRVDLYRVKIWDSA
jgi:hypothetical protein